MIKDKQYVKFCSYGFLKNLRFFDAFFILFLVEKGLPYTQIGILYAVREIAINILEVPSGIVADTWGRKSALTGSFIAYILSFLVFYFSADFWWFFLAFILYGIGEAFRSGTHKGMIMDYLKINHWEDQKIYYYGHTRAWSQKGSAISSLVAGLIVFYTGMYRDIFLYSVIPYFINLLLILSYPKELNHSIKPSERTEPGVGATLRSFWQIIRKPHVLQIINTSALHTAYLKAVKDYIQPLMIHVSLLLPVLLHVEQEKKNGIVVGALYFFIYLLTSRASQISSRVADKSKRNISYTTLLWGFSFGIFSGVCFYYGLWVVSFVAFVGIYIVENIRKPILTGFVADRVPNEILASVISAQSLLKTVMTAGIALVFGILADHYGIGVAFVLVSAFLIVSTVTINLYRAQNRKQL
ncbi:MAG: MFS transporter [Bacteroidetes bacterium]|nr:MAG: MFS transporter [Bacteroidota bacterium]RLD47758.1 MAG: MFS transporter [Bacteroidota bacterium]RLD69575.1 MAG: MFS transporter [Bacteroidota bacterium]RLD87076.1 MAG: MFS transporter [Bacteroidota bacterium]